MVKYLFILFFIIHFNVSAEDQSVLFYKKAMEAKTVGEREENFEKALKDYLANYNQNRDAGKRNGYLSFNIANCYMNLGQLGHAIVYYKEANELLPENEKISSELKRSLSKRVSPIDVRGDMIFNKLLFFHFGWSYQLKLTLLLIFTSLITITGFVLFKFKVRFLKPLLVVSIFIYGVLLVSIIVKDSSQTNIGVVVKACNIHIDAGENYAFVNKALINVGSTIKVLGFQADWYQVILNDGHKGYIHKDELLLIL